MATTAEWQYQVSSLTDPTANFWDPIPTVSPAASPRSSAMVREMMTFPLAGVPREVAVTSDPKMATADPVPSLLARVWVTPRGVTPETPSADCQVLSWFSCTLESVHVVVDPVLASTTRSAGTCTTAATLRWARPPARPVRKPTSTQMRATTTVMRANRPLAKARSRRARNMGTPCRCRRNHLPGENPCRNQRVVWLWGDSRRRRTSTFWMTRGEGAWWHGHVGCAPTLGADENDRTCS